MRSGTRLLTVSVVLLSLLIVSQLFAQDAATAARSLAGLGPEPTRQVAAGPSARAGASEFGPTSLVFQTIAAKQFSAYDSAMTWGDSGNTELYRIGGSQWFDAAIDVPAGAKLQYLEVEACNTSGANDMTAWVFDMAVPAGAPTFYPDVAGVQIGHGSGCGFFFNLVPFGLTIDRANRTQMVRIRLTATDDTNRFRAVRLYYLLQVSPAPGVATFTDVPTGHLFFQFVEALAASGISVGYADGRFGVDDPVTRGQMAVFLAKALGLHFPN